MSSVILLDAFMSIPGFLEVPTAGIQLHKPHSAFHQPPRHEAVATEFIGGFAADPVLLQCLLSFLGQINGLRSCRLHAVGQFIGGDAGSQLRPAWPRCHVSLVQVPQHGQL